MGRVSSVFTPYMRQPGKYINLASGASAMPSNHLPCDWRQTGLSGRGFKSEGSFGGHFVPVTQDASGNTANRHTSASVGAYGIEEQCAYFSPWRSCELKSLETTQDLPAAVDAEADGVEGYVRLGEKYCSCGGLGKSGCDGKEGRPSLVHAVASSNAVDPQTAYPLYTYVETASECGENCNALGAACAGFLFSDTDEVRQNQNLSSQCALYLGGGHLDVDTDLGPGQSEGIPGSLLLPEDRWNGAGGSGEPNFQRQRLQHRLRLQVGTKQARL